jgi:arylsulfatase A-like enzyme
LSTGTEVITENSGAIVKRFVRVLLVVTLLGGLLNRLAIGAEGSRFNVLFIAVDDLRPEFGAYGKHYIHAPNLDRLAGQSMTFVHAYCQQAVCAPSRSSLLTGTRPDTTRVYDLETHFRKAIPDVVTLPQHFKQHGYFVQGMGKIFHGGLEDPRSWSVPTTQPAARHGAYGLEASSAIVQARVEASKGVPKKPGGGKVRNYGPAFEGADVPDNTFHDGQLAEMAVKALGECAQKDQPFWLGVGFIRPHLPFVAPKKYWDLYDPAKIELAPNPFKPKGAPEYAVSSGGELRSYHGIPNGPIPDDLARQLKHGYYAAISYMDAQLGRVLDELDRLGLAEKTIIVLWGDHGWKLGEHGAWCKHTNVENDTNAPLLMMVPGITPGGKRTEALVEFVDIYPTLAELCGLPLPEHLEGTSLVPVLQVPSQSVKAAAFSQYPRSVGGRQLMGYSMRTGQYRFTRWVERDDHAKVDAVELYDHDTDPQENVNIAGDPANAGLVADLTEQWKSGWRVYRENSN